MKSNPNKTRFRLFLVGGVLGFIIDAAYWSIVEKKLTFAGYLSTVTGKMVPFLPIYGFGLILIYLVQPFLVKQKLFLRGIILGVSLTLLEFWGGLFTVATTNQRLWDYSGHFLNLYGHIDLLHTLYWTILGTAVSFFFEKYPPEEWSWKRILQKENKEK
ncbi:putative ABC transporter permease [Candidatus Woesearchaeota archaeon]|nr:putative ABC transporter permease [Candidatus Woesearchaeota archaeon]